MPGQIEPGIMSLKPAMAWVEKRSVAMAMEWRHHLSMQ